jgi:hypothetical protein
MYHACAIHPLSDHQKTRLMKGMGVTIKPGGSSSIPLDMHQMKKYERAKLLGKGMVVNAHPHQIGMLGGNIESMFRDTASYLRPLADASMDRAIREVGRGTNNKVKRGKGSFDFLDPSKNGTQQFFERDLPSNLIHQGLPVMGSTLGGIGGTFLSGPIGGFAGGYAGQEAGRALGDEIGRQTGYGLMNDAFSMAKSHGKKMAKTALSKAHTKAKEMAGHYLDMGLSKGNEMIGEGGMGSRKKKGGRMHMKRGKSLLVA